MPASQGIRTPNHRTRELQLVLYLVMCLPLQRSPSPLPLQCEGGDQPLNLGGLAVGLAVLALKSTPVCVDVLAYVVLLSQVEELPDLGSPLRSPHARLVVICESWQHSWT